MLWRELTNHVTDCSFCDTDVTEINGKKRSSLKYPDLQSARRPVDNCEVPVPVFGDLPDIRDEHSSCDHDEEDEVILGDNASPFSRNKLNDLGRDLSLSKSGFTKYPCFLCMWDRKDKVNH